MKNTVSESMEVLVAKSNSFKDFDFVVTAFGKAVSNRLTIKCQEKNKNICEFCKPRNWYDKKSNRLVAQKQVFRGNKIIVCMILLLFINGK